MGSGVSSAQNPREHLRCVDVERGGKIPVYRHLEFPPPLVAVNEDCFLV